MGASTFEAPFSKEGVNMESIAVLLKEWGVPVGLVILYVYRDWKREEKFMELQAKFTMFLEERLIEEKARTEVITQVVTNSVLSIQLSTKTMEEFCKALSKRPCLVEK
jgi:hypothetical protein